MIAGRHATGTGGCKSAGATHKQQQQQTGSRGPSLPPRSTTQGTRPSSHPSTALGGSQFPGLSLGGMLGAAVRAGGMAVRAAVTIRHYEEDEMFAAVGGEDLAMMEEMGITDLPFDLAEEVSWEAFKVEF